MNFAVFQTFIYCGTITVTAIQIVKEDWHEFVVFEWVFLLIMLLMHICKIVIDLQKINIVFSISNQGRFKNQIEVPESEINKILEKLSKRFTHKQSLHTSYASKRLMSMDSISLQSN